MIVLLVVTLLITAFHLYRETIVRKFANSALQEQGITVTELSIQSLQPSYVRLSQLVLEQDSGTRISMSDVTFPMNLTGAGPVSVTIGELILLPGGTAEPPAPARLLRTFLSLPNTARAVSFTISSMIVPGVPPLSDLSWQVATGTQRASLSAGALQLKLTVSNDADTSYNADIGASVGDFPDALTLSLTVRERDGGLTIAGDSTVSLAALDGPLQSLGYLPDVINELAANLHGPVTLLLPDDALQPSTVTAELSLIDDFSADYRSTDGEMLHVRGDTGQPISVSFIYPSLEWSVTFGQLEVHTKIGDNFELPLMLNTLTCRSELSCRADAALETGPLTFGDVSVSDVHMSATLGIDVGTNTNILVDPDMLLTISVIETPALSASSIEVTNASAAQLYFDDDGWRGDFSSAELLIRGLTDHQNLTATLPVELASVELRDSGNAVIADINIRPGLAELSWGNVGIVAPGISGSASYRQQQLDTKLAVHDESGTLSAQLEAAYEISSGEGSVLLRDAALDFAKAPLSARLLEWPYPWDVVAGELSGEFDLHWSGNSPDSTYGGNARYRLRNLAGNYGDVAFAGLDQSMSAEIDSRAGVTLSPSEVAVSMIDVGVPVQDIKADFSLDLQEKTVQVDNLSMSLLGGTLLGDPFLYGMDEEQRYDVVLRPKSIQLQFMLDLAEFDDIKLSGSISGVIPLAIKGKTITVTEGRLQSDPPGGVIRYLPGIDAGDSPLDVVSRALANLQFDSLTSDVTYTENGDLKQQMRLTGINPDMDDRQPVILNLGVENNIPSMLKSMQATRTIEEIFERRSGQ